MVLVSVSSSYFTLAGPIPEVYFVGYTPRAWDPRSLHFIPNCHLYFCLLQRLRNKLLYTSYIILKCQVYIIDYLFVFPSQQDRLDLEYQEKLQANQLSTDVRTAKKREKRQRAKQRLRDKRKKGNAGKAVKQDSSSESSSSEAEDAQEGDGKDPDNSPSNKEDTDKQSLQGAQKENCDQAIKDTPENASATTEQSVNTGTKKSLKELLRESTAKLPSETFVTGSQR